MLRSLVVVSSRSLSRPQQLLRPQQHVRALSAAPAKPAGGAAPAAKGGKAAPAKGGAAKGKKAGKESKLGTTVTPGSSGFAVGEKIPISILKESQDPVVKADKDYPEWLWKVAEVPTIADCTRILEEAEARGEKNVAVAVRLQRLKRTVSARQPKAEYLSVSRTELTMSFCGKIGENQEL